MLGAKVAVGYGHTGFSKAIRLINSINVSNWAVLDWRKCMGRGQKEKL